MNRAVLAALVVMGCGGTQAAPPPPPATPPPPSDSREIQGSIAKMTEYRDRVCKCADKACTDQVIDDMTKWSEEMGKKPQQNVNPTQQQMTQMNEIGETFQACMQKTMGDPPPP